MIALLSGGGGEAGACAPTDVPANTPAITMAARTSHFPRSRMGPLWRPPVGAFREKYVTRAGGK